MWRTHYQNQTLTSRYIPIPAWQQLNNDILFTLRSTFKAKNKKPWTVPFYLLLKCRDVWLHLRRAAKIIGQIPTEQIKMDKHHFERPPSMVKSSSTFPRTYCNRFCGIKRIFNCRNTCFQLADLFFISNDSGGLQRCFDLELLDLEHCKEKLLVVCCTDLMTEWPETGALKHRSSAISLYKDWIPH